MCMQCLGGSKKKRRVGLLSLVLGKHLGTVNQTTLGVLTAVDKVGVVQSQLDSAVDNVVNRLHTQHERVVLVADLVAPAAETATRPDALLLKLGQDLGQSALTLQRWGGVAVVEAAVVGGDNLVTRTEHLGVDQTLDGVGQESVVVDGLHRRLRHFQHDGPVGTLPGLAVLGLRAVRQLDGGQLLRALRLVVGGVVGEDGGPVEGAVVLGEVQPALVTNALRPRATDTHTDNVGGGVEELLGGGDQVGVGHGVGQEVDGHGGDQTLVANSSTIGHFNSLAVGVDLGDLALLTEASVLLGDGVGHGNPDTTGTTASGETEGRVGTPVTSGLVQDDVGGDGLEVGGSHTLTKPSTLHLGGRHSPDLVVVRTHEDIGDTGTHHAADPLVKVLGLGVGNTALQGSIDHTIDTLDLLVLGQHGDVVLEGVGDPFIVAADVRDTLVAIPVIIAGEGLVDTVIEVLVVREDNVTTDIVELKKKKRNCGQKKIFYILFRECERGDRHTKPSGVTSVEAKPPGVSLLSTINQEGPF